MFSSISEKERIKTNEQTKNVAELNSRIEKKRPERRELLLSHEETWTMQRRKKGRKSSYAQSVISVRDCNRMGTCDFLSRRAPSEQQ